MCVPGLFLSYQPLDTPDPYFPRRDGGNVIWEPTVRAYLHNFTFVAFFADNTVLSQWLRMTGSDRGGGGNLYTQNVT